MDLQKTFYQLLKRIGFTEENIDKHWVDLKKAYSHKTRHYHNLKHLEEMLVCFEIYKSELQYPDEVLYALFYHDIIYNSTQKDNELKSAELAVRLLPEIATINKQMIFDLIMATKSHVANSDSDEKWIIDFDLKILAKDPENYKIYASQIRKEYSIYPDFLYNPGRKKALEHFLEKEYIYQTEIFRTIFESKARANIQEEIGRL